MLRPRHFIQMSASDLFAARLDALINMNTWSAKLLKLEINFLRERANRQPPSTIISSLKKFLFLELEKGCLGKKSLGSTLYIMAENNVESNLRLFKLICSTLCSQFRKIKSKLIIALVVIICFVFNRSKFSWKFSHLVSFFSTSTRPYVLGITAGMATT